MLIWFFFWFLKSYCALVIRVQWKKNCRSEVCFSILCILWIWILIPTIWFTNLWTLTTSKKDCWIISQDCQDCWIFLGLICYLFAVLQHSNFSVSPKDLNLEDFIYFLWHFPFLLSHWLVAALIKFVMF